HLHLASSTMRVAIVGGEQVTSEQVAILKTINPDIAIYNEYGPTEATVGCVVARLEQEAPVVIGRPIDGTWIYILSPELQLCAIGVAGEICIGGVGLARGYLNHQELTAERFIADPYRPGERVYRN